MFMRRRPLLRAAAVGGTAYMVGKSNARRQDQQAAMDADQEQRLNDLEQQQAYQAPPPQPQPPAAPPPAAPPPAEASSPMLDQLNQLAALHQQGVLTDEEFTAAKAKLFGT
jgi:hypothetical protein